MKALFLALFTLVSTSAFADVSFTHVECGDHWFKVSAKLDAEAMTATVNFSGDGVQDEQTYAATVTEESYVVIALSGRDDALMINTHDDVHGIFWGVYRQGDQTTHLGLCDVN